MSWRWLTPLLAVATVVLPSAASAAPTSTSFAVTGYEYAFTRSVGSFAGSGSGNDEAAVWNARVEHDPLGSTPTHVNGGAFQLGTLSMGNRHVDYATGTITRHSGTITTLKSGANCTNQEYRVTGALEDVATRTTSRGSGSFQVTLTHSRVSILGHCVIYKASVKGRVTFTH
jgi:hypothetical protein